MKPSDFQPPRFSFFMPLAIDNPLSTINFLTGWTCYDAFITFCPVMPMPDELTLQIKTTFAAVHSANEAASQWLAERHAPGNIQYLANLVIEELVTNCIKYGYEDHGEHDVEVRVQLSANELAVIVTDDGNPFNPLELPAPDLQAPVADRPIGGLGIHLLRQMSDRMDYVRADGKNQVTVRKSIGV
jgi:anti-sigma regulatory factor (Ser/Thr protein kinase)